MRASHVVAVPSSPAVTTSDPSGLNEAPLSTALPGSVNTCSCWPVAVLQIRASPSPLAVTISVPSGENVASFIPAPPGSFTVRTDWPVATSQISASVPCTVTTWVPCRLNAADVTESWPGGWKASTTWPVDTSQMRADTPPAVSTSVPFGLNEASLISGLNDALSLSGPAGSINRRNGRSVAALQMVAAPSEPSRLAVTNSVPLGLNAVVRIDRP